MKILGDPTACCKGDHPQANDAKCKTFLYDARQTRPQPLEHGLLSASGRHSRPQGQKGGQQQLVGEDHDGHAQGCCDGQLPHNLNVDQRNHDKAKRIRQQRDRPGNQQLAEGAHRGGWRIESGQALGSPGLRHLDGMRDRNRKDEEGDQDGERVQAKPKQGHEAQQPDHRNHGAAQGVKGERHRSVVDEQEHTGQDKRHSKIHQDARSTVGNVTRRLGKPNDVHTVLLVLVASSDLLKRLRHRLKIEARSGLRVPLLKAGSHQGRTAVSRHNAPHPIRLGHIGSDLLDLLGPALEIGRNNVAASKPLLHHFGEADVGGEERCDGAALNPLNVEDLLGDLAQQIQAGLVIEIARFRSNSHQDSIRPSKGGLMLREDLHEGMVQRDHLGKCCISLQPCGSTPSQKDSQHRKDDQPEPTSSHKALRKALHSVHGKAFHWASNPLRPCVPESQIWSRASWAMPERLPSQTVWSVKFLPSSRLTATTPCPPTSTTEPSLSCAEATQA